MEEPAIEKNSLEETKKPRKKFWILVFIGILGVISVIYVTTDNPFRNETPLNNISFGQVICSQIRVTPTWVGKVGILEEGYSNFNNSNPKDAVDLLINAQVYLVYHSDCGACKSQIGYFGTEWGRYVGSGYTIDCKDI